MNADLTTVLVAILGVPGTLSSPLLGRVTLLGSAKNSKNAGTYMPGSVRLRVSIHRNFELICASSGMVLSRPTNTAGLRGQGKHTATFIQTRR
jgi:hypothetical protein